MQGRVCQVKCVSFCKFFFANCYFRPLELHVKGAEHRRLALDMEPQRTDTYRAKKSTIN